MSVKNIATNNIVIYNYDIVALLVLTISTLLGGFIVFNGITGNMIITGPSAFVAFVGLIPTVVGSAAILHIVNDIRSRR